MPFVSGFCLSQEFQLGSNQI